MLLLFPVAALAQDSASENLRIAIEINKKGEYEASILFCTRALEIDNTMSDAFFLRGFNHYTLENYREAIRDFSATIYLDDTFLDAYLYRAKCKQATNNFIGAVKDFNKARELNSAQATLFMLKGFFSSIFGGKEKKTQLAR
ncbi:MAG: tetratricopeptide repeat protein [Bacteroidales bacterium]